MPLDQDKVSNWVKVANTPSVTLASNPADPLAVEIAQQTGDAVRVTVDPPISIGQIEIVDQNHPGEIASVHPIADQIEPTDNGLVTNSIIHGLSSQGGGTYHDVKVDPAGKLLTIASQDNGDIWRTEITQQTGDSLLVRVDDTVTTSPAYGVSVDAGFRHRVSQMRTLIDLKTLNADDSLLLENTGTGTGSWTNNTYQMSVTSGQYLIRRSKQYVHYFSGKSHFVELTFDDFHTQANVQKRVGYFSSNAVAPYDSDKDGIWLEDDGTTKRLIVSKFGVETFNIPIANWHNAAIAQAYDWSKFTVIVFDFLWLGGATLRMFLKTDAGFILLHTIAQAGNGDGTFTRSPNHPVRYEIRSTTGSGTFHYICAQVATEGSTDENGKLACTPIQATAISCATVGTTYLMRGVRHRSGYRDKVFVVLDFDTFVTSNADQAIVSMHLNATLSAAPTWTAIANTGIEAAIGNGTITLTAPGHLLWAKAIFQNSDFPHRFLVDDFLSHPGMSIADVSDEVCIGLTPITATVSAYAHMRCKEY